ncbi:hypothetical protein SF83666_c38430 [Sinorhizobium fredii CCBAU 83666]|nr:hypothetical protein SF83666_c38430 [Sinorhizobium fredii CCBAU 83666]
MAVIVALTLLTQIGGLIWLLSLWISRLWPRVDSSTRRHALRSATLPSNS